MVCFLIVDVMVSFVCNSLITSLTQNGLQTNQQQQAAALSIITGISVSAALYLVASFNLNGGADIWDYDELNMTGYLNIFSQISGAVGIVENAVMGAFLLVSELKRKGSSVENVSHVTKPVAEKQTSVSEQVPASNAPMPQGRVPAWKQVEMEKQNQNQ